MKVSPAARTSLITFGVLTALVVLLAFQNCAPVLPLDGVVDASSMSVRATATPAPITTTTGSRSGSGTYTGSKYDGVCTSSNADDPMATNTNADVPGGPLVIFNQSSSGQPSNGHAAFWNLSGGSVARATVCYLSGSGWSVQAVGDFNGDSNPDVIWRNTNGDTVVWLMTGSARTSTALVANIPSASYNIEGTADFDGDLKDDLLVRDTNNGLTILKMNGTGTPTSIPLGTAAAGSHLLEIGSYYDAAAAKKKIALFFTDAAGTITVWYLNGTSVASQAVLPSGFTSTGAKTYTVLGVGDFNGDGNSDFFLQEAATGNIHIRFATYSGNGLAVSGDGGDNQPIPAAWTLQGVRRINGDIDSDWLWIVSGGSYPVLAYTPVANAPGALSSIGYIRSGWALFKYSHL